MFSRKIVFMMIGIVLFALAACGGSETAAPVTPEIDLTSLPAAIDVQTVNAIKDRPDVYMLDVREPDEFAAGHIPGITLIPMGDVPDRLSEIPADKTVVVTCRSGNRSGQIADYLRGLGYESVHNMDGGILAWQEAGLPVEQ